MSEEIPCPECGCAGDHDELDAHAPAIVVDMDDVVANTAARGANAKAAYPLDTDEFWATYNVPELYGLDDPIPQAWATLWRLYKRGCAILYVSGGRAQGSEYWTGMWLGEHKFPPPTVIEHLPDGQPVSEWMEAVIRRLILDYDIQAGYGGEDYAIAIYERLGIKAHLVTREGDGWA